MSNNWEIEREAAQRREEYDASQINYSQDEVNQAVNAAFRAGEKEGISLERIRIAKRLLTWIAAYHWAEDGIGAHVVPYTELLKEIENATEQN